MSMPTLDRAVCAICLALASGQFVTTASSPTDVARSSAALPPIDLCPSCFTLVIRERAALGWCRPGRHWGPENVECHYHRAYFRPPWSPGGHVDAAGHRPAALVSAR